ncbi:MAG TPA: phosphate-starvation-inducible PsiE family protein [Acidiferrobacterales bacterium]|jgi:protein PsiE
MRNPSHEPDRRVLYALHLAEWAGLLIISLATLVAIGQEVMLMVDNRHVRLEDILLLFIYLEVLTMVGLYVSSGKLPLRYPIYIAIVALARYIIIGMDKTEPHVMIYLAAAILILALAVLAVRFGHVRFPYDEP